MVVGEAIHEKRTPSATGKAIDPKLAAWQGVHSVSVATVFGVLTTIAAFSPMLWINSELAKVLAGFSAVVIFALIFSLVESKFILPSHLAQIESKPRRNIITRIQGKAQQMLQAFNLRVYKPVLEHALNY